MIPLLADLSSLGDVYAAMGDYDKALENHEALDTSAKRMTPMGASASESIGRIFMNQGVWELRGRHAGFRERIRPQRTRVWTWPSL